MKNCSNCGKLFHCGNPGKCWCSDLPHIMPMETNADCLCKDCLIDIQNENINHLIKTNSLEDILEIVSKYKNEELIERLDYTVESGKWIFTKWYHLKRGFCCYKNCVNCPY